MKRFEGKGVPDSPRIAVIANDAIGNFVISTPLLQMLRQQYKPQTIHYFGGVRTMELQAASDLFERHFALHGTGLRETYLQVKDESYDLVVNVEQGSLAKSFAAMISGEQTLVSGPCLGQRSDLEYQSDAVGDLWRDRDWLSEDVTSRFPFLQSGWIGEIFCRLAYLEGPIPGYRLPVDEPPDSIPDVLIATSASLPEKLWPTEKWLDTLNQLRGLGLSIGLIGAKPANNKTWLGSDTESALVESGAVEDLRGTLTLPQVCGAMRTARLVLSLDNGIMHLAAGSGTSTIGLFRHGIHRLWAPPLPHIKVLTPGEGNTVCDITVEAVVAACRESL